MSKQLPGTVLQPGQIGEEKAVCNADLINAQSIARRDARLAEQDSSCQNCAELQHALSLALRYANPADFLYACALADREAYKERAETAERAITAEKAEGDKNFNAYADAFERVVGLESQLEAMTRERDEARAAVVEACDLHYSWIVGEYPESYWKHAKEQLDPIRQWAGVLVAQEGQGQEK